MGTKMLKGMDCAFQDSSYPCDYKDEGKLPDCELCLKIRKAGIREVVEWLKKWHREEGGIELLSNWNGILIYEQDWQAKLKEWGIDNG